MNKLAHLRYAFLVLSAVLLLIATNGYTVKNQLTHLNVEVTLLGHEVLYLRDEAIAFNSGHSVTPHVITRGVVNTERRLESFVSNAHGSHVDVFNQNTQRINSAIDDFSKEFRNLTQSIDNLVALIITRNNALHTLSDRDKSINTLPAEIAASLRLSNEQNLRFVERYNALNKEISLLISDMVLGHRGEFVEATENALKEMEFHTFQMSVVLFSLSLLSLIGFILLSSWHRVDKLSELNLKLTEMTKNAERANQAKTLFLATMSHELRTPMNGVLGMAQLIADETQELSTKKNIQIINDSGEHLVTILNDILDFSKVEQGLIELERHPFKFHQLIDPVTNALRPIANEKDIILEVESNISEDITFAGDSSRLRQVLFNLVGNAIKFTNKGSVKIICDYKVSENQLGMWIQDTGLGISKDKLTDIFEPFRQAESSTSRKFGGTGLGLSIVKNIIETMKGAISVVSNEGKGSTFVITVPLDVIDEYVEDVEVLAAKPRISAIESLDILITDDNAVNAMVAKRLCEKMGHQVDIAVDGQKSIEALEAKPYDLILMDKHMPELDGIGAIHYIRQKMRSPVIIFACTADVFKEAHDEFLDIGANHVLTKPIQKSSIESAIQHFMNDFERLRNARGITTQGAETSNVVCLSRMPKSALPMTEEELSSSSTLAVFDDDKEEQRCLILLMIEEFEKASDNLINAFSRGDLDMLFNALHVVKGTALNLDMPSLAKLAKENEEKARMNISPGSTTLQKILNLMSVNIHQANRILDLHTAEKAEKQIKHR
ncbi:ATP-binding protein [Enterovibrio norvegicus]|uniref:ATP-binding protein n=1 Tax=Enterovibrio norvegicus TaxID=188144 RepID=UPI00352BF484